MLRSPGDPVNVDAKSEPAPVVVVRLVRSYRALRELNELAALPDLLQHGYLVPQPFFIEGRRQNVLVTYTLASRVLQVIRSVF